MAKCNIKKSQALDTDSEELFVLAGDVSEANALAIEQAFPYFIYNDSIFMTIKQRPFSMKESDTGFMRNDLIED